MVPRTKVFVGSLPPGSNPEELRRLFENYGVVTECDIMNRCGFVHMETAEMAENAIKALNNTNFKGTNILVEPGRMKDRGGKGQGGGGGGGAGGRGRMGNGGNRRDGGRMGGGGGGGGGGMGRNFGGPRQGNNFGGGNQGGNMGGGGAMRRDRGFQQRKPSGPYNKGGPMSGKIGGLFDRWQGGNRGFDNDNVLGAALNSISQMGMGGGGGGGSMGGFDRFNGGGFGMGNQDRRGFALPENQMFGNDMGNKGRGGPMGGGNYGGMSAGNNQMFGNLGRQGGGGGGFNDGGGDMFARRGNFGGNMNNDDMGGGRGGGFNRNNMGGGPKNFNQSFPPLGGGGMGNRNGPQRDNMMTNRRY